MPAYSFEALSANGETRKGTIDADSAKAARSLLRTLISQHIRDGDSSVAGQDAAGASAARGGSGPVHCQ